MKSLCLISLVFALLFPLTETAAANPGFQPVFDLRVRQEKLDGALWTKAAEEELLRVAQ